MFPTIFLKLRLDSIFPLISIIESLIITWANQINQKIIIPILYLCFLIEWFVYHLFFLKILLLPQNQKLPHFFKKLFFLFWVVSRIKHVL
jgi:hypothetical protein